MLRPCLTARVIMLPGWGMLMDVMHVLRFSAVLSAGIGWLVRLGGVLPGVFHDLNVSVRMVTASIIPKIVRNHHTS